MRAFHALWDHQGTGELLIWAEDGDLPAQGPARRGRRPAAPRPLPHPFAAPTARIVADTLDLGPALAGTAVSAATEGTAVLWLPGAATAPDASTQLVHAGSEPFDRPPDRPGAEEAVGLWPFIVPVLRLPPGPALDLLLSLVDVRTPDLHAGSSITVLAAVGGLALEMVAGGRILPDLVVGEDGRRVARWAALRSGLDEDRVRQLSAALPPSCRSLGRDTPGARRSAAGPSEADPGAIVAHALETIVDAVCREGLQHSRRMLAIPSRRSSTGATSAVEAWLEALVSPTPEVLAEPGELIKLEELVAEWRTDAAGRRGAWRLCLRLCEPEVETEDEPFNATAARSAGAVAEERWRVELLLQATDDLSLIVEAAEVWRSGTQLRHATRTLEAPHEVLLAELGRAVRVFPDLLPALREPAPTGLDTDLAGAHRFLAEVSPALEVAGFGVLLPSWWRRPSSRLGVKLKSTTKSRSRVAGGLLNEQGLCEFDWQAALGGQEVSAAELRRLAKLKAPLVRVRGQWMELRPGEAEQLLAFLDSGRRRAARTMTVSEVLRVATGTEAHSSGVPVVGVEADGLLGALLRGDLEEKLEVRHTPEGFAGELRPYQRRGVAWLDLLERTGLGACLADDMGLGKTAMVLALLQAERDASAPPAGPTLVVCPTSVVGNWEREAQRFTPGLVVYVHHGATRARAEAFAAHVAGVDVVITSYALVDRDRAALSAMTWGRIVLDEAQNVKNPEAKQTKAVRALQATRRLALTGTPVENHLGELWSIMEILNPGLLGTASSFREQFAIPIERYREEDAAERLRTLTRPFVLRRLKTDRTIITDLPDKIEMKVLCNLTREQATLYKAVVDEMLRRIRESEGIERKGLVLATMLRLKQVCNHPAQFLADGSALGGRSGKLERTVEILDEVRQGNERALVFSQFAEMGEMLRNHLQHRLGSEVAFLHGGVPRKRRDAMVEEFNDESADIPFMVLSLKAGGTGLNLTAANHVVHYDRWWNPAVENQATDRAFRIGQRRNVQVRKLVCTGTLEDRIDQMIESKQELADRIVGAGEGWLTELSTDELAKVFRLSAHAVGSA